MRFLLYFLFPIIMVQETISEALDIGTEIASEAAAEAVDIGTEIASEAFAEATTEAVAGAAEVAADGIGTLAPLNRASYLMTGKSIQSHLSNGLEAMGNARKCCQVDNLCPRSIHWQPFILRPSGYKGSQRSSQGSRKVNENRSSPSKIVSSSFVCKRLRRFSRSLLISAQIYQSEISDFNNRRKSISWHIALQS